MKLYFAMSVVVLVVFAVGAGAVLAGSANVTGTLTPGGLQEPQVATITTPNCTGGYVAFSVLYAAYAFKVDVGGIYTFDEPGVESAMYLYQGSFDPNFPATNCIAASNTNPLNFTATLTAGRTYYLAVIEDTFAQDGMGYSITINGPGNIFVGDSVNLNGLLIPGGPVEPQVAIISTPNCTGAYTAFSVLYRAYALKVDVAGVYTFDEPGSESAMYVYQGSFDPNFPATNCIAASNTNPLNLTVTLTAGVTYYVAVIEDTFTQDGMAYNITISGPGNIFLCDEFDNGIVDWLVVKPSVIESGGSLVLTPTSRKAEAIGMPFFAPCATCSIDVSVRTAGGASNKVWILGWYVDKKNDIELLLKEENDAIVLKQKVNGQLVAKQKAAVHIDPNTTYQVVMSFNGAQITVSVGGSTLINMNTVGIPVGVPGVRAKNTTATFDSVCVD